MANDRMYIRCKGCGQVMFLAKTLCSGYYTKYDNVGERLDAFFDEHTYCCCDLPGHDSGHLQDFELVYESEDGIDMSNEFKFEEQ